LARIYLAKSGFDRSSGQNRFLAAECAFQKHPI